MNASELINSAYDSGLMIHLHGRDLKIIGRQETLTTWLPTIREQKAEIIADLGVRHHGWVIHFDQCEETVFYHPAVNCVRVHEQYPAAVKAEPIIKPRRQATPSERTELRELIAETLTDTPEDIEEAFAAGLADIDTALECFQNIAAKEETV